MSNIYSGYGGYQNLKSFKIAQLIYDVTVHFCNFHIDQFSRTRDQMTQAARSGVQNIAEGSLASVTSKKTERVRLQYDVICWYIYVAGFRSNNRDKQRFLT